MQPFPNDPNIVSEAQSLTLSQFQQSPLFLGMINAICSPLQDLQDTLYSMNTQFVNSNLGGTILDIIGLYVGITRQGYSDPVFNLLIQVQIAINNTHGWPDEIITIMQLITGATNVLYLQYQPASESLQVNIDLPSYLNSIGVSPQFFYSLIEEAVPLGVQLLEIDYYDPVQPFGFYGNPRALGFDQGHWGSRL